MSKLSFEPTECDGSPREFVGMHRPTFQDFWRNAQADPGAYPFGVGVYPNRARNPGCAETAIVLSIARRRLVLHYCYNIGTRTKEPGLSIPVPHIPVCNCRLGSRTIPAHRSQWAKRQERRHPMKQDVYQSITDRIVTAIEEGKTVPWQKPWRSSGGMPVSLSTGRPYRGINVLLLALSGYDDPRFGTYKAIGDAGGQVRKGEKATQIVLWKTVPRKPGPGDEEPGNYWLMRFFSVFNARQADGLPELEEEEQRVFTPIQLAEKVVGGYVFDPGSANPGPPVMYGYDRAAYSASLDSVTMPEPQQFDSDESFYTTLFHELVHSTGHEKRLARIEPALFGTDPYAKEELVAEIGASFLAGMAGFEDAGGDQSAAYVAGWLKPLSGDPKFVVQAAAQAQKAADAIIRDSFDVNESAIADREVVGA